MRFARIWTTYNKTYNWEAENWAVAKFEALEIRQKSFWLRKLQHKCNEVAMKLVQILNKSWELVCKNESKFRKMRQPFFDELKKKIENHASKNLHKNETKSTRTEVKNEWNFEENRIKCKQKSKFARAIFENYKSKKLQRSATKTWRNVSNFWKKLE